MKKEIDMVAITPSKANAQHLTCLISFIASIVFAVGLMLLACVLPAMVTEVTEITCWISMALEAASIGLCYVAFWIKTRAL